MPKFEKRNGMGLFILRLGIGLVFFIFGFDKFFSPGPWGVFLPFFITELSSRNAFSVLNFIQLQGIVEMVVGLQLIVGIFTQVTAGMAVLILGLIVFTLGFDPIGIRDMGLFFSSLAILFLGAGEISLDALLKKMDIQSTLDKNEKK